MTPAGALAALGLEGEGAVFVLPGRERVFGAGPARELARGLEGLPHPGSLGHVVLDAPGEHVTTAELRRFLHRAARLLAPDGIAVWCDRDPEIAERAGLFPGSVLEEGGRHRSLRQHLELLRLFPFRPLTPRPVRDDRPRLVLAGARERPAAAFSGSREETEGIERAEARYGTGSLYRRFDRLFEPEILDDLLYGLARLRLPEAPRVLALGCNDGLELEAVGEVLGHDRAELWGIDLAPSAIEAARARFPSTRSASSSATSPSSPGSTCRASTRSSS
ncbi:MAG: hypothetical protein R3F20_13065 [Planctomycetota bacterium]